MSLERIEQCRECALRLLSQRPHSMGELRAKLTSRSYSRRIIDPLLADFERVGLLNDAEYARLYCEQRLLGSRPIGERRVTQELWKRHIPAEMAKVAVAEVLGREDVATELARAVEAARGKLRLLRHQEADPRRTKEKLARFLGGRGFSGDICWQAADVALGDTDTLG